MYVYRDETSAFLGSVFKLRFHVLISCLLFFLIADRVPQYYSLIDNKPTSYIYIYILGLLSIRIVCTKNKNVERIVVVYIEQIIILK